MQENSETLDRSIDEFGSVDGIVRNVNPDIDELVGGNQRTLKFAAQPTTKIVITHRYEEPTSTGTVAVGYVKFGAERWPYREVNWDKLKHDKGVVLANQQAGTNDNDLLAERYNDILLDDPNALDDLFITPAEVEALQDGWVDHDEPEAEPEREAGPKVPKYSLAQLITLRTAFVHETGIKDNGFLQWLKSREGDVS